MVEVICGDVQRWREFFESYEAWNEAEVEVVVDEGLVEYSSHRNELTQKR